MFMCSKRTTCRLKKNRTNSHDFLIPTSYFAGKWAGSTQGRGSVVGRHTIENVEGAVDAPPVMVRVVVTDLA